MKKLKDLLNNFIHFFIDNKKIFFISLILLAFIIVFILNLKNFYYGELFYPDKSKTSLIYEKRAILYGQNRLDRITKIVNELLLGPDTSKSYNIFSQKSKLLNAMIINNTLILNLSKPTLSDLNWERNKNISNYYLALQSIVVTVCFHDKFIDCVKFYFDGEEYSYAGEYGNLSIGVKPDWKILKN